MKTSKYNLITFIPLNLLEQFTRVANTYFLILVLVQLIPDVVPAIPSVSSVSAATTIIPLVFVLGVTAVKDAFDDIVRSCMHVSLHKLMYTHTHVTYSHVHVTYSHVHVTYSHVHVTYSHVHVTYSHVHVTCLLRIHTQTLSVFGPGKALYIRFSML